MIQFSRCKEGSRGRLQIAQKPKLFKVQLVVKDVTANAPGRPRCFLCLSIGQHG